MSPKTYKVIGLMSGTSLDGIDVALLETDGKTITRTGPALSVPYNVELQADLHTVMTKAIEWGFRGPPPNQFSKIEEQLDRAHIEAVETFLRKHQISKDDINLIGYHGQTVLHRAATSDQAGATLQLGNGHRLSHALETDIIFDFRSADVKAGGQGAPLAPIYHKALLAKAGLENAAILNIGGVSNITLSTPDERLLASDCGPGNGPLDSWVLKRSGRSYDQDGLISRKGTPDFGLVDKWMSRSFYSLPLPRSADRYDFDVLEELAEYSVPDGAATLVAYIAEGVHRTLADMAASPSEVIICGGGRHNPIIMAALNERIGCSIVPCEQYGWDGDALEAQAFAFLAARHINNLPLSVPGTTGVPTPIKGGKIATYVGK